MKTMSDGFDPAAAKQAIFEYCKKRGALAVGVADLAALERIAPVGHRPSDLMPRVRSVISLGVGGQTQGAWQMPAKAMAYSGSTEVRAYKVAYGCSFFIEQKFAAPSIYVPPDIDPESGPRVPFQSMKLHAEVAGIGARSLAGDILLHPEFGFMYYASVFTELELAPDAPMAENPCPAPSCVSMYRATGRTPHEILPGAVLGWRDRCCGSPEDHALRHGEVRGIHAGIRSGAEDSCGSRSGRSSFARSRRAARSGPQDALVQGLGRLRRVVRAMFRVHARVPNRDARAPFGPHSARRSRATSIRAQGRVTWPVG
jgi:hypothetical protein